MFFLFLYPQWLQKFYIPSMVLIFAMAFVSALWAARSVLKREECALMYFISLSVLIGGVAFDTFVNYEDWPLMFNNHAVLGIVLFGIIQAIVLGTRLNRYINKMENEVQQRTEEIEHLLRLQMRHALIGEIHHFVVHQWKQNIYAISLYAGSLKNMLTNEHSSMSEKTDLAINQIERNIESMTATVDTFNEFLSPPDPDKHFSVQRVCGEALNLMKDTLSVNSIRLETYFTCDLEIKGYGAEFKQVVINLLDNARKIHEQRRVQDPFIRISTEINEHWFLLTLEDNAGGFEPGKREQVFEEYYSTFSSGSGIELYMARRILSERFHGGLTAEAGAQGARFVISLDQVLRKLPAGHMLP